MKCDDCKYCIETPRAGSPAKKECVYFAVYDAPDWIGQFYADVTTSNITECDTYRERS